MAIHNNKTQQERFHTQQVDELRDAKRREEAVIPLMTFFPVKMIIIADDAEASLSRRLGLGNGKDEWNTMPIGVEKDAGSWCIKAVVTF